MGNTLIFEKSKEGRRGCRIPEKDVPSASLDLIPGYMIRKNASKLPEVSELDISRHFNHLSYKNFCIDTNFYPLGSCTMKYNPKLNEKIASMEGLSKVHPLQPIETIQGTLAILYNLKEILSQIVGLPCVSLQPAAGAQGEMVGMLIVDAYFKSKSEKRTKVIVPDSAHGTNPATAKMCGFDVIEVPSNASGQVDIEVLKQVVDKDVAAIMLTNPNTLGIFEENILEIASIIHQVGGLLYYDGANLNAIMGLARPGDMGFDIVHINTHKTFSTPHGGGGPGAGPVAVTEKLKDFLPKPLIEFDGARYFLNDDRPHSIGKVKSFYGNFGVLLRAYTYILSMGKDGLRKASEDAILNANYLRHNLKTSYTLPHDSVCMHEFVLSANKQKEKGASAMAVAKSLIDYGIHPPTIYFPLNVPEALMIEPTETESLEVLDTFIEVMHKIARDIDKDVKTVLEAPTTTAVRKVDEALAARKLNLKYKEDLQ